MPPVVAEPLFDANEPDLYEDVDDSKCQSYNKDDYIQKLEDEN